MKHQRIAFSIAVVLAAALAPVAHAIDVAAGDWKLSFSGNVNAHYIYSNCESSSSPIINVGGACVATDKSSSVSNGLLPAALTVSGTTTQSGYDIGFTFGFYPGISTNDGGSPNIQATAGPTHTALGTAGLDIRQVFLTFGNSTMGTVKAGRDIGLFGADAILNDMTLLGVGAGNGNYAAPANTSLGSIGLGYIYTDWLAQINYTTPDLSGAKVTVGIFDPLNAILVLQSGALRSLATNKNAPGFHAKVAYTAGPLYLSGTFLYQKQKGTIAVGTGDYNAHAFDIGGRYDYEGWQFLAWYYNGTGVGTTGLFVLSNDDAGNARDSDGFLAQVTYKIGPTKLGVNYGESKLKTAGGEVAPRLVEKNDKVTAGLYHDLTANLMLLAEFSQLESKNQRGDKNKSNNFNVGAFLKF